MLLNSLYFLFIFCSPPSFAYSVTHYTYARDFSSLVKVYYVSEWTRRIIMYTIARVRGGDGGWVVCCRIRLIRRNSWLRSLSSSSNFVDVPEIRRWYGNASHCLVASTLRVWRSCSVWTRIFRLCSAEAHGERGCIYNFVCVCGCVS